MSRVPENLNKENLWNEMHQKYPKAMKIFCDWIDQYKLDNNWWILFNEGASNRIRVQGELDTDVRYKSVETKAPKYHDLPIAMQIGIWFEFVRDRGGCEYNIDLFSYTPQEEIEELLKLIEEEQE